RDIAKRLLLLANMDFRKIVGSDLAQRVDVDEQRRVRRCLAVPDVVLELLRVVGDMVQNQVQTYVVALRQTLHVVPVTQARIDLTMGERRKTAVRIGWKGRQEVYASDRAIEPTFYEGGKILQVVANPVRIGDELNFALKGHNRSS